MNPLIKKFGKSPRFVSWKLETRKGKTTKLPYQINGALASSTDPSTWDTYANIKKKSKNVGIVLTDTKLLICVDMDHVLKNGKISHEKNDMIADFLLSADSYTEISQSGEGLHIFFELTEAFDLVANKSEPFEVYVSGRYIAITENSYYKTEKEVRSVTPADMVGLLALLGYPWGKVPLSTKKKAIVNQQSSTSTMPDDGLLAKMFDSKNGSSIKKLYEGDLSAHNKDASSADMALCSHLAFWTGKDSSQMERLWLASPLGSRKKTQDRPDYRERTISAAIINCKEVYETKSQKIEKEAEELDLLFVLNQYKEKVYIQNTENICRVIRGHVAFRSRFRYDTFKNTYEIGVEHKDKAVQKWLYRTLEDSDAIDVQTSISIFFSCFAKVGKDMVYDAIIKVSKENKIDSASDFIKALQWDKKSRLDSWLSKVYGTDDDAYHRAVGSNWLKGLVRRIIEPGCKFDYVLVLEGEQGSKKSTSLSVLGGAWHIETTMSTDSKDFFMQFSGKTIVEFSEGETLSRTEVKRMKAIITTQIDKYRPPYERTSQDFPRRCVFAMTTNQTEYLKDETGNRRWLPVTVKKEEADVEWLAENREQLFAEAYARLLAGETVYEFPKQATADAQNERRIKDPNADIIVDWYFNKLTSDQRSNGVAIYQAYKDAINGGFTSKALDRYTEMMISDTFKNVIGLEKRRVMISNARTYMWFKQGSVSPDLEQDDNELDPKSEAEKVFSILDR